MSGLGVDALLILPFTAEFSQLSPADFIVKVLVDKLHARAVIEGPNFRFGHRAAAYRRRAPLDEALILRSTPSRS